MSKRSTKASPIPPDVYTREYFLQDRKGSGEFVNTGGYQLCPQHIKAMRLAEIHKGQIVLDVGCGCGELTFHSALRGAQAIGIDYSPAAVALAEEALRHFPHPIVERTHFILATAEHLELRKIVPEAGVDVVFLMDVLEHLHPWQIRDLYRELSLILKPNGRIVCHTWPNRWHTTYTYPLMRLVLRLVGIHKSREVREKHDEIMHVNEQTLWSVWRDATRAGFKTKVWMEHGSSNASRFLGRVIYAIFHYWPPLSYFFADDIWCVATKSPSQTALKKTG
jgi:2-polyprenyl-3-methyl-5-hydroxy-6-metoxy-1,4-benzoquinol methylase